MSRKLPIAARIRRRVRRDAKRTYWRFGRASGNEQCLVFIVGCQRSGTGMLLDLFERDLRSRTFGEFSSIAEQGGIRIKPLAAVREEIRRSQEPLIVCKPLVESQRIAEILDFFPGSKALWAYRRYLDVVNSNVNEFHSQVESCRIVVDREPGNWRSEVVSQASFELIQHHYDPTMSRYNAAALMWHVRNSLFFEQNLAENPAVRLWRYEDFVENPSRGTYDMYEWLGMRTPSLRISDFVSSGSVGLGQGIKLDSEIDAACRTLLNRLDELQHQDGAQASG